MNDMGSAAGELTDAVNTIPAGSVIAGKITDVQDAINILNFTLITNLFDKLESALADVPDVGVVFPELDKVGRRDVITLLPTLYM